MASVVLAVSAVIGSGLEHTLGYRSRHLPPERLAGILVVAEMLSGEDPAGRGFVSGLGEAVEASQDAGESRIAERERDLVSAQEIRQRGRRGTADVGTGSRIARGR